MNYKYPLTILTPTYNRSNTLPTLYKSLCNQTYQNFQWLVIDDGSSDETYLYFKNNLNDNFLIDYYYKPNGGKHTALNYSHKYIKGELVCIVDSDDWLLPDAVDTIIKEWQKYKNNKKIRGLTFQKGKSWNSAICDKFEDKSIISNHIDYRVNGKRKGDCCEVITTDTFKEFPFPEFKNEKFLGEGYLWNNIGFKYDIVYIKKIIYICDYLDGGLTKSGRILRLNCPLGGMENSKSFLKSDTNRKVNLKILIKESWLYVCYAKFAGYKYTEIIRTTPKKLFVSINYIFGLFLYFFWKHKYVLKNEVNS